MLGFAQEKSQFRTLDACSVIDGLASNIKALIERLPLEDKETFAYLVSYFSEYAGVERVLERRFWSNARLKSQPSHLLTYNGKDSKKAAFGKKGNHQPSFRCDCFLCYVFHWSRWDASPNQGLIHEAILLNESVDLSKAQDTVFNRAEWKTQRGLIKYCDRSTSLIGSNRTDMNDVYMQTSSGLKFDDVLSLEHEDFLACSFEKVPAVEIVVAETIFQRRGIMESRPRRPSTEEIKPRKKKIVKRIDTSLKEGTCSPVTKNVEELPTKYKAKQVALIFYRHVCTPDVSSLEPDAKSQEEAASNNTDAEPRKVQTSLSHIFAEILNFVADRLFAMWQSRRPGRISVF